jgi:hypothetical protein
LEDSLTEITGNRRLAELARDVADQHGGNSLERRAAACAGVALAMTKTVTAARRCLEEDLDDLEVRGAALQVLNEVAGQGDPG